MTTAIETSARDRIRGGTLAILLTGSAGCTVTVLDTNIVGVVLPSIARDFAAPFSAIQWIVSAYILCFAALLLPAGSLADRFGRRGTFLIGIAIFALASLCCGAAATPLILTLARALQGLGAALLLASALAVIAHTFHDPAARSRAWSIWGAIMGLAMVASPLTGGLIAQALGWRWAFYVNLPILAALAAAVIVCVPPSRDPEARSLDPLGIVLFAGAMLALTWGLIDAPGEGWTSLVTLVRFGGGAAALGGFVVAELRQSRPMLDLQLFAGRRFVGAVLAMFAYAATAQVMASWLPQFWQNGLGFSVLQAALAMLPFALAMLVFPQVGRRLGETRSSRAILALGLAVTAFGNAATAWGAHQGSALLAGAGMAILGAGGGLLNGETQKAIMGSVPHGRAGMASGISTTARFSGILIGFTGLSAILGLLVRARVAPAAPCAPADMVCRLLPSVPDRIAAGDFAHAFEALPVAARAAAVDQGHHLYAGAFGAALGASATFAAFAALCVLTLMRPTDPLSS